MYKEACHLTAEDTEGAEERRERLFFHPNRVRLTHAIVSPPGRHQSVLAGRLNQYIVTLSFYVSASTARSRTQRATSGTSQR